MRQPLTDEQRDLAAANINLAKWGVGRLARHFPTLDSDSVFSACQLGICIAAQKHDPAKGELSTIAIRWMRHCCQEEEEASRPIAVPRYCLRGSKRELEANPEMVLRARSVMSLRRMRMTRGGTCIFTCIAAGRSAEIEADAKDEARHLLGMLDKGPRDVVSAVIMDGFPAAEVARWRGVTKQAVDGTVRRAVNRIRKAVAS